MSPEKLTRRRYSAAIVNGINFYRATKNTEKSIQNVIITRTYYAGVSSAINHK